MLFIAIIVAVCIGLSSCATTGPKVPGADVIEHQVRAELAAGTAERIGEISSRVENRIDDIAERAGQIGDGLQRLAFLFEEYDRTVQFFVGEMRRLQTELDKEKQDPDYTANYMYSQDLRNDSRNNPMD